VEGFFEKITRLAAALAHIRHVADTVPLSGGAPVRIVASAVYLFFVKQTCSAIWGDSINGTEVAFHESMRSTTTMGRQ
jgi:hypothetical protein